MAAHLPHDSSGPGPGADGVPGSASAGAPRAAAGPSSAVTAGGVVAVVGGAALGWALAVAPSNAFHLVAIGGGAGLAVTVAAVATAAWQWRSARLAKAFITRARARVQRAERDLAALDAARRDAEQARRDAQDAAAARAAAEADAARLSTETLPTAFARIRHADPVDQVLAETARPASGALDGVLELAVGEVAAAERRGATAMDACASAAARIQARTTRMLAGLKEMEHRHGDEKVFADLIELDHQLSQLGRLADSVALLAGGRSGRRWTKPIPMESLLRGALGRIDAYQRIRIHSTSPSAVAGYAAEGVMHALAELMDNATAFSTHGSEVHVYVEEEDAGVVIMIEDSGLGMRRRERDRAEGLVTRQLDLSTLPGTRLGLAVVGKVADRYGLSVNFRPSSRGGTGVVVMIPRALITQPGLPVDEAPGEYSGTPSAPAPPETSELAGGDEQGDDGLGGDLPVRPRGQTLAEARERGGQSQTADPARPPHDSGSRFASFRRSGKGGPGTTDVPPTDIPPADVPPADGQTESQE
jgi:signal transduction histidine kinase